VLWHKRSEKTVIQRKLQVCENRLLSAFWAVNDPICEGTSFIGDFIAAGKFTYYDSNTGKPLYIAPCGLA
jgi:hypothetical protein